MYIKKIIELDLYIIYYSYIKIKNAMFVIGINAFMHMIYFSNYFVIFIVIIYIL